MEYYLVYIVTSIVFCIVTDVELLCIVTDRVLPCIVTVILFHLIIKYDFINFDLSVSCVPLCIY